MARVYRVATVEDVPQLIELATQGRKRLVDLPDVVLVAELDGVIEAAVGVSIQDGYVVAGPGIMSPRVYGNPFVALRLHEKLEAWLLGNDCHAYLFSVYETNTRMRRWAERTGARHYVSEKRRAWFYKEIHAPIQKAA
jgi:hypothetical protein